jgi:hypothetical protein
MDDLERTFREGLRAAAVQKPPLDPIDLDDVTTRPVDVVPRHRPARWLAVAAAVVLVAGIGAGAWALNGRGAGVPAIPAAPTTSPTAGQSSKPTSSPAPTPVVPSLPPGVICHLTSPGETLRPDLVSVKVVNTGKVGGLAKLTVGYLRANGFHVTSYHETMSGSASTTIRGAAADSPEVRLVQHFFPGSIADGDGRADHSVDVLVATQFTDASDPDASVPVTGMLCLPAVPVTGVQVRIRNDSAWTFDSVWAVLPDGTRKDYGKLAAGAATDYLDVTQAYGYGSVTVVTMGRTLTFEPADYVGPLPLRAGQYTYELGVDRDGLTVALMTKR